MYRIRKTDLVLLHSRGKVHEIISHTIAEDADVEWSVLRENSQATMYQQEKNQGKCKNLKSIHDQ